jgi:hypothetical protein
MKRVRPDPAVATIWIVIAVVVSIVIWRVITGNGNG